MSGQVDPISFPTAWDYIFVGGVINPGVCKVSEFKRAHEFDVKKGKGALGATVTFVGRPPAKGSIQFLLWKSQHFVDWDIFRALLKYDPTKKKVQAIDIYHPSLADIDVNSVVTESIGNIVHEGDGLYSITVEFLEYFPPPNKPAVSTPTGAQQNVQLTNTLYPGAFEQHPPPLDQQMQNTIAGLMAQASAP